MKVRKTVNIMNPLFQRVTLRPGDEIPEWAVGMITNPKLIEPETTVSVESVTVESSGDDTRPVDYAGMRKGELQELCRARGLDDQGKVDELRARLHADDLKDIDADVWSMDVAELRELAAAKGIDVGEASTTAELAAAIEQATK